MILEDTILAVSSPPGAGGVRAIVRLSGPQAWALAEGVTEGLCRRVGWQEAGITTAGLKVRGAVLLFGGPRSFTGQDAAELHVPNSAALVTLLLEALARAGARLAEPGEFSARAFFNGKVDLTCAEGIAATIAAGNATQLRAAASLRQGDLHRWTQGLAEELANVLALVEAGIDFADEEEIEFLSAQRLEAALARLGEEMQRQLAEAVRIDRLTAPPTVAFVGRPNVGKSSLINALSGSARSIVSPVAGTTRDVLAAAMTGARGEIRLLDMPGEEVPEDELRQKMMAARAAALLDADLVVEVLADPAVAPAAEAGNRQVRVWNKCDLYGAPPGCHGWQVVSARTGAGIPELRAALGALLAAEPIAGAARLVLNHRHRGLVAEAAGHVEAARRLVERPGFPVELVAADLRRGLDALGQMTGTISPDEVLGRIFAQFCIGK